MNLIDHCLDTVGCLLVNLSVVHAPDNYLERGLVARTAPALLIF